VNFSSSSAARVLRDVVGSALDRFSRYAVSAVCVSVLAFMVVGAVGASSAVAALAPGYGPLGESGDPGISNVTGAGDVAVDEVTGNILFGDPGNDRVFVMAPDLTTGSTAVASVLSQFSVVAPGGIAVDQLTHAVYVNEGVSSIGTPGGLADRAVRLRRRPDTDLHGGSEFCESDLAALRWTVGGGPGDA
jgi:hypothetical protein